MKLHKVFGKSKNIDINIFPDIIEEIFSSASNHQYLLFIFYKNLSTFRIMKSLICNIYKSTTQKKIAIFKLYNFLYFIKRCERNMQKKIKKK